VNPLIIGHFDAIEAHLISSPVILNYALICPTLHTTCTKQMILYSLRPTFQMYWLLLPKSKRARNEYKEWTMPEKVRPIAEAAARLTEPFTHTVVGQVDDYCAYLSRFKGAYRFHQHAHDEMYYVIEGEVYIDYLGGESVRLHPGDTLVVKAYETHRSRADDDALVLMFKAKDLFAE